MTLSIALRRGLTPLFVAALATLSACHSSADLVTHASALAPRALTPRVLVAQTGNSAVITLSLDARGDVGTLGSFTGRFTYDPAVLTFVEEVPLSDGTLRASNPALGSIRFAGAARAGVNIAQLASYRFTVLNANKLAELRFELDEVHDIGRANLATYVRHGDGTTVFK
ncbi:MAG: hypothetical protein NTZ43_01370 [Gemmatimonadetes bacterium]|nr:hypothetical protein [Gemmatimonadota bacterium]